MRKVLSPFLLICINPHSLPLCLLLATAGVFLVFLTLLVFCSAHFDVGVPPAFGVYGITVR